MPASLAANSLGFDPVLPILQMVTFGLLLVVLAVWLYRREIKTARRPWVMGMLAVMRASVITGIAFILLNPIWTEASRENSKPPLLVLVDTSHSMAVQDIGRQRRFDVAKSAVLGNSKLLREYSKHYTPFFFSLDETAARREPTAFAKMAKPNGDRTWLGESMLASLSTTPGMAPGGLLLISDGRNNGEIDPVAVARQAKARKFAVFTLCLGSTTHGRDVAMLNRRPQVHAAPDQEVPLTAEVRSIGYGGENARVQLLKDGRLVGSKTVQLNDRRPVPVSFPVQENKEGSYRYTMSVLSMPQEGSASNNRSSVFLQVLKSKARVLILEGRPTWDVKFLIQALRNDPSIEVDAIFKLNKNKFFAEQASTPNEGSGATPNKTTEPTTTVKVPTTPAELGKYDVVIIGKGYEEFFADATGAALKKYVADHAGNLIFLRGQATERPGGLQVLEPVQWSDEQIRDFRMEVTTQGISHPAFSFRQGQDAQTVVQKLPTLVSATRVKGEKALSVVLARSKGVTMTEPGSNGKEMAVLAYQNYGQGRVVSLVGQGLWRWAFLPPELESYASCYNDFWTQLIRWMVNQSDFLPGQDVSLRTDRTSYSPGDTVNVMAFVRGQKQKGPMSLKVTSPDGRAAKISLGKAGGTQADYTGTFKPRAAGEYMISLATSQSHSRMVMVPFSVFPAQEEDIVTAADPDLMRSIAHAGGGEVLSVKQLMDLPEKLKGAQSLLNLKTETITAWDRWWVLATILGLLSLEWLLRRRAGLV